MGSSSDVAATTTFDPDDASTGSDLLFMSGYAQRRRPVAVGPHMYTIEQGRLGGRLSGLLWPSEIVLACLVDGGWGAVEGRRVVELGAGCALAAMVALRAGAGHVVVTETAEGLEDARRCVRHNCGAKVEVEGPSRLSFAECDWTAAVSDEGGGPLAGCEVALVSDCVHLPELHGPLVAVLAALPATCEVLLTSQVRRPAVEQAFYAALRAATGRVPVAHPLGRHAEALQKHFGPQQLRFLYAVSLVRAEGGAEEGAAAAPRIAALADAEESLRSARFPSPEAGGGGGGGHEEEEEEPDSIFL